MTLICVLGTDLSARFQNILIGAQVGALLLFAVVALAKVAGGDAPEGSLDPSLSWLNPFEIDETSALIAGLLTGVFIYWGWESAVNLTEEVEDSASAPGRAAVISTLILLVTYVAVAIAVVAFAGPRPDRRVRGRRRDPLDARDRRARHAAGTSSSCSRC